MLNFAYENLYYTIKLLIHNIQNHLKIIYHFILTIYINKIS